MTKQDCKEVFAKLSEYLDGDLPQNVCEEMTEHIHDCAPCVAFVESLKKSIAIVRESRELAVAGPVKEEVRAQMWAAFEQFKRGDGQM